MGLKPLAFSTLAFGSALAGFALTGCAGVSPDIQRQCLPLATYTAAQQQELKREFNGLPQAAELRRAMLDYEALRDADRAACGQPQVLAGASL